MHDKKPDIFAARACYGNKGRYDATESGSFSQYSPAYVVTNEPLEWETRLTPNANSVLTVAGSGDQALFYKLAGAKYIDTFDVSYCARAIQDIKTTAIRNISRRAYQELLFELYQTAYAADADGLFPLLFNLPKDTLDFIRQMDECRIFGYGGNLSHYTFNRAQYRKLQSCIPEFFNFIWSDITTLHTKLNKKYDVINLSNILDYLQYDERNKVISKMSQFLTYGGHIVFCNGPYVQINIDKGKLKMTKHIDLCPKVLSLISSAITLEKIR